MTIATPDLKLFAAHGGGQSRRPFRFGQAGIDGQFLVSATESLWKNEPHLRDRGKVELALPAKPEKRTSEKKIFWL